MPALIDAARWNTALLTAALTLMCGCSGKVDNTDAGPAGGPVSGATDSHCDLADGGNLVQPTSQASCYPDAGADTGDGGVGAYGDTLYNAEGNDDDCKYHLAFTSTPVRENTDVTFTVTATRRSDNQPATGAAVLAEVFLSDTHPAPNSNQQTSEAAGGKYTIGPVRFDSPGRWTIRFHLYEDCADMLDDSPHGHAAFYLDVP
jgi:hypothetical protein